MRNRVIFARKDLRGPEYALSLLLLPVLQLPSVVLAEGRYGRSAAVLPAALRGTWDGFRVKIARERAWR